MKRSTFGPDGQFTIVSAADHRPSAPRNIQIWAVTVQNEPEHNAPWEACCYTAEDAWRALKLQTDGHRHTQRFRKFKPTVLDFDL